MASGSAIALQAIFYLVLSKDWFIFVLDNSLKGRKRINDLFCNLEAEIKRIKVENA